MTLPETAGACQHMAFKHVGVIYHRGIGNLLHKHLAPQSGDSEAGKASQQCIRGWQDLLDFESWMAPSPERIESFLANKTIIASEIADMVSDYRHFRDVDEIRRRDVFVRQ